ncbi:lecithin retinol acyltransferase family protein [Endozoicomonadaceae bacterium StTr2]
MQRYPAGTVLKIDCIAFWHFGLADGDGGVIHNSRKRGRVTRETLEDFADGRDIVVSDIMGDDPDDAVKQAEKLLGTRYRVMSENCEHFVRHVHGLNKESRQIQQYVLAAVGAGTALLTKNKILKTAALTMASASLSTPAEKKPYRRALVAAGLAAGQFWYKNRKAKKAAAKQQDKNETTQKQSDDELTATKDSVAPQDSV